MILKFDGFFSDLTLAGDPEGDFQLHASTGALSTSHGLDRERKAEYNLEIVVTDRGSPALSATATVHVKVLDVNDNSPIFTRVSYSAEVSEDVKEGSQILEASSNREQISMLNAHYGEQLIDTLFAFYSFAGVSNGCR